MLIISLTNLTSTLYKSFTRQKDRNLPKERFHNGREVSDLFTATHSKLCKSTAHQTANSQLTKYV